MTMTVSLNCLGRVAVAALLVAAIHQPCLGGFIGTVGAISDEGVLVGTSYDPHNDTVSRVNDVIGDGPGTDNGWNETFTTDPLHPLALTSVLLQNFEGTPPVGTVSGSPFAISDFDWFSLEDPGGGATSVTWTAPDGMATATFYQISSSDILAFPVVAFMYNQADGLDAAIQYYTAKSDATDGGFSVWSYTVGGLNVAYVDENGDIDVSSDGTSVVFDPRPTDKKNPFDLSHINLWGDVVIPPTEIAPEPGSITLLGIGFVGALGFVRRRRRA